MPLGQLGIALGELKERIAALERDMALIKRLAGRAILLASIWSAGLISMLNADQISSVLAQFLRRLIGL
jgi:hypothetical protein